MQLPGILLISAGLSLASITAFKAICDHADRAENARETGALDNLKARQAQAKSRCAGSDTCVLTVMFPEGDR